MGLVPKKARSDVRLHKTFTLNRVMGLIITIVITTVLVGIVVPKLQLLFYVFMTIAYLILSGKSPENKDKAFYIGLKQWLGYKFKHKTMYGDTNEQVQKQERSRQSEKERRLAKKAKKSKVSKHNK